MATIRSQRINEEIRRETESIIARELKDPRLGGMVSVVRAEVTRDLANAKLYVSMMGTEEEKKENLLALKSASGFIRKQLSMRLEIRRIPLLVFVMDESIEFAVNMAQRIDEVVQHDQSK